MKNKRALITGASAGIGKAVALSLLDKGSELLLIARREERLQEIKKISPGRIHILSIDVNDPSFSLAVEEFSEKNIDILINNAGLALGREKVESALFSDWEQMIQTNITGAFKVAHLILPWMLKKGGGDIINLSSIAAHYTYQGGAVYCATKHAVQAFTRVLREETAGRNIRVMQISPGMVNTEFSNVRFKGDQSQADAVYAGMTPLTGEDIARMMIFMLEQPRHVVIDEIITMPADQGGPITIHRSER